ncbi:MAG: N-acetylmuramoyl-L-alanine amidase [Candidatus Hatepunaea meridiana]|nr:N-acetylmuramoyl-L-alanine amidase [Candidatus Hatepunaea meridiana]
MDGTIEEGRSPDMPGAHVKGFNHNSIGICLIGKQQFTQRQFLSLAKLLKKLKTDYPGTQLVGHYELIKPGDTPKTCPNIDMDWFRSVGVS